MKSKILRVMFIMVALTLISSCFVGSTFARFMSSAGGTSSAVTATWVFKQGTTAITNSFDFNLFDTSGIYELNSNGNVDTTQKDGDILQKGGNAIIAPGCGGKVDLSFKNESTVDALYVITFSEYTSTGMPIQLSSDNSTWKNLHEFKLEGTVQRGQSIDKTVYWRWQDSVGEEQYLNENVTIEAVAKFEQKTN